tara:strand:- start:188 stop:442 length:255 start_codon:yes stop_codon:yes gene_type:complete
MTQAIITAHGFTVQAVEAIFDFFRSVNEKRIERKAIRETEKELWKLSIKELDDIGITRGDIYTIARTKDTIATVRANNNLRGWV